ncbi:MBOAT family O-acyltransferase [Pseudoroseomonas globiformis]|uniref:Probable alginate O-acetylase AlgI n=1 Tax=Teichococcus globiformis TaxID=2307229 RepID=A0ABV7G183_9PROT
MLFNSAIFIAGFLPVVLLGFFLFAGTGRQRLAGLWLTLASLVFYGWWDPQYLPLLVGSIGFNYLLGGYLLKRPSRLVLGLGIAANLALLGFYKYTGFLLGAADDAFGLGWEAPSIILPLAISFFTFQQIAYLSDAHDGAVVEHDFLNYCLFITFFPHLIAGPITHHREMLSQFGNTENFRPRFDNISVGTTLFVLGLFKKVVFADPMGAEAGPVFAAAQAGAALPFLDAWGGALAYALQLYFDFSGYTDMAIGLGLLFGISLPPNFNSPYKAHNVIDYWSRWHMTLTRFLTAYVYNPIVLGVTRRRVAAGKPLPKRGKMSAGTFFALVAYPTLLTMFISGVWHGAGWQFVAFGLLHGFYLVVAHGWRALKTQWGWKLDSDKLIHKVPAVALTFFCVVIGAVFFRAPSLEGALNMLAGMAGLNGVLLPTSFARIPGLEPVAGLLGIAFEPGPFFRPVLGLQIVLLLVFCWSLPNTQQFMGRYRTALGWRPTTAWVQRALPFATWRPSAGFAVVVGLLGFFAMAKAMSAAPTEFLYFQF